MPETATVQISMPEMGESVTEGIVLEWHVAEGDSVNEGDTVVEVSTDKVDAEVPAPMDGVITKLVAAVDDEVPVGAPLAEMEAGEGSDAGTGRWGRGSCLRYGPRANWSESRTSPPTAEAGEGSGFQRIRQWPAADVARRPWLGGLLRPTGSIWVRSGYGAWGEGD